jgi:hypothetical protein
LVIVDSVAIEIPEPDGDPRDLVDADLTDALKDQIAASTRVPVGEEVVIDLGPEKAGAWIAIESSAGDTTRSLNNVKTGISLRNGGGSGWVQVRPNGTVSIPGLSAKGVLRIAVQDSKTKLMGWTVVSVGSTSRGPTTTVTTPPQLNKIAPKMVAGPSLKGAARVGKTISALSGEWEKSSELTISYRWFTCEAAKPTQAKKPKGCTRISGAELATLKLLKQYLGKFITFRVKAANEAGSMVYFSKTKKVKPKK